MFTFILSIVGVVIGCIFYPVGNYLSEKKFKDKNLEAEVEFYGLGMMLLGEVLFIFCGAFLVADIVVFFKTGQFIQLQKY